MKNPLLENENNYFYINGFKFSKINSIFKVNIIEKNGDKRKVTILGRDLEQYKKYHIDIQKVKRIITIDKREDGS